MPFVYHLGPQGPFQGSRNPIAENGDRCPGSGTSVAFNGRHRTTECERRNREVIVETQNAEVKPSWDKLVEEIWDEIARTHTLIDQVSDELSQLVNDDCSEPLQILEKNAESRVLQAYYRGLRYAFDRTPNMWNQSDPGNIR
jgi:hypothetical protein